MIFLHFPKSLISLRKFCLPITDVCPSLLQVLEELLSLSAVGRRCSAGQDPRLRRGKSIVIVLVARVCCLFGSTHMALDTLHLSFPVSFRSFFGTYYFRAFLCDFNGGAEEPALVP